MTLEKNTRASSKMWRDNRFHFMTNKELEDEAKNAHFEQKRNEAKQELEKRKLNKTL